MAVVRLFSRSIVSFYGHFHLLTHSRAAARFAYTHNIDSLFYSVLSKHSHTKLSCLFRVVLSVAFSATAYIFSMAQFAEC